jgi:hypothetical protein
MWLLDEVPSAKVYAQPQLWLFGGAVRLSQVPRSALGQQVFQHIGAVGDQAVDV